MRPIARSSSCYTIHCSHLQEVIVKFQESCQKWSQVKRKRGRRTVFMILLTLLIIDDSSPTILNDALVSVPLRDNSRWCGSG